MPLVVTGQSDIYKWTDEHGHVHYSDKAPQSEPAEKLELAIPEGIAITNDGTRLLVIESESSSLTEIDLDTGERTTIATDLQLLPTVVPALNAGWFNDVDVDAEGNMFVNSDGGNIIYKFPPGTVVE